MINKYMFYSDYLKSNSRTNKKILVAKTKKSYLIGPLLDEKFNSSSFVKRIKSNCIHKPNIYKKMLSFKCKKLLLKYESLLESNEVIEVFRNGSTITHKILKVPGDKE